MQKVRHQEPTEVAVLTTDSEDSNDYQKQGNENLLEAEGVPGSSNICVLYEAKISALMRKNSTLERQLASALAGRDIAEKNLASAVKNRHDAENKLAETAKEVELLKEKLAGVELAQEEANSLSNAVHSDNVKLEHDVAFLKAILDDTQKVGAAKT